MKTGGHRVVGEIRKAGGTAEFVRCNIGRPAEVDAAFRFATDKFGRLDILHNNAIVFVPAARRRHDRAVAEGDQRRADLLLVLHQGRARS